MGEEQKRMTRNGQEELNFREVALIDISLENMRKEYTLLMEDLRNFVSTKMGHGSLYEDWIQRDSGIRVQKIV